MVERPRSPHPGGLGRDGPRRNALIRIASRLYHLSRRESRAASRGHELGVVTALTPSGTATVRAFGTEIPIEGTRVTDRMGRLSGRVVRVFGPTTRPYWSVRPRRPPREAEVALWLGATLVEEEGTPNAR